MLYLTDSHCKLYVVWLEKQEENPWCNRSKKESNVFLGHTKVNVLTLGIWPNMACTVEAEAANVLAFPFTSERAQQPLATNIKTQHMQTVSNKWMQRPHPPERDREQ